MTAEERDEATPGMQRRHVLGGLITAGALLAVEAPHAGAKPAAEAATGRVGSATAPAALMDVSDDLAAHIANPTGAHAASAISVAPPLTGELVSTDVQAGLEEMHALVVGQLAHSPDYLQGYAHIYEEFFGTSLASGSVGSQGWKVFTNTGSALTAAAQAIDNAPGFYNLTATDAGGLCTITLDPVGLTSNREFIFEARVMMPSINGGSQECTWRAGLCNANGLTPTNGYYFEYSAADTTLHCFTAKAPTGTPPTAIPQARSDHDSNETFLADQWYRLRIVCDGGPAVTFFIDDEPVATETNAANMPNGTQSYGPLFSIFKTLGSGTTRTLRVDYAHLTIGVVR